MFRVMNCLDDNTTMKGLLCLSICHYLIATNRGGLPTATKKSMAMSKVATKWLSPELYVQRHMIMGGDVK